jgi:hypothetical protein
LQGNTKIDSVDISWPSGGVEHLKNLDVDQIYMVEEGTGIRPQENPPTP